MKKNPFQLKMSCFYSPGEYSLSGQLFVFKTLEVSPGKPVQTGSRGGHPVPLVV